MSKARIERLEKVFKLEDHDSFPRKLLRSLTAEELIELENIILMPASLEKTREYEVFSSKHFDSELNGK